MFLFCSGVLKGFLFDCLLGFFFVGVFDFGFFGEHLVLRSWGSGGYFCLFVGVVVFWLIFLFCLFGSFVVVVF